VPEHIRSDNGSELTAKCVREWLGRVGVKTLFIEPGSPWENGYVESFFRYAPGRTAGTGSVRHAARGQGAHRAVEAALQHCPAAQCPWVSPPGSRGAAALCGRLGYASATAQGWSVGGQTPNLKTGVIHGGRPGLFGRGFGGGGERGNRASQTTAGNGGGTSPETVISGHFDGVRPVI
jgi:hypothetical protein